MKIYVYCDEDDHPIYQARTKRELAEMVGINENSVYRGFRDGYRPYAVIEVDDDDDDDDFCSRAERRQDETAQ